MSRSGVGSRKTCLHHRKTTTEVGVDDTPSPATLTPDGGDSAAQPDEFFRSPAFLAAEGVTHSLQFGAGGPVAPVIVREIPDSDSVDAISPYGYPGAKPGSSGCIPAGDLDWSQTGLVSVFIREAIGVGPCVEGGTERSRVWISDPAAESGMRKRLREQVRRNERRGWEMGVSPGPEVSSSQLSGFSRAYAETMARTGASSRYLFEDSYFERIFSSDVCWLVTASNDGEVLAGAIAVRSDGLLHYFLGGTAAAGLDDSPMKNLFATMIELSSEMQLPLNLGGGVEPGDSLDQFKRGFANDDLPFVTHEIVCDGDAYSRLTRDAGAEPGGGFFPAYRA